MRIYIKSKPNFLMIRIPIKKNPYLIIPLLTMIILWIPFLFNFTEKSLITNILTTKLIWLTVLSIWFILGAIGFTFLIWILFGYEEILIKNDFLVTSKPLIFYVRNSFYDKSTISGIRLDKEVYNARKNGVWQEKTRNVIRMETPNKTVSFARGIETLEGEAILINLATSGIFEQNQFHVEHKA